MQWLSNLYESVDALSAKYGEHTLFWARAGWRISTRSTPATGARSRNGMSPGSPARPHASAWGSPCSWEKSPSAGRRSPTPHLCFLRPSFPPLLSASHRVKNLISRDPRAKGLCPWRAQVGEHEGLLVGGYCGLVPRRIAPHRDVAEEPQSIRQAAMFLVLAGLRLLVCVSSVCDRRGRRDLGRRARPRRRGVDVQRRRLAAAGTGAAQVAPIHDRLPLDPE